MTREAEQLVETLWQRIWIDDQLDPLTDIVADPFVRHTRDGTETTTPQAYAEHISSATSTLRGTEVRFDHIASVDDHVFARITLFGFNMAAEKPMQITWLTQYRIADGRIAEVWTLHQADLVW